MIVFVTTCRGRAQHIELTLPKNLHNNLGNNCKFVVLDYNSQDHLASYLQSNYFKEFIDSGKLVVYSYPAASVFRMSHAKNLGSRLGILEGADILVNLDADNYTGPGFADFVEEQFRQPEIFLWAGIVQGKGRKFRGCSGRIGVSVRAFLNTGGYDEKYETYAPDDKDFNARLQRLGLTAVQIDDQYLEAIPHGDGMRFAEYPHVRPSAYEEEFEVLNSADATVVNCGKLGMGLVYRNWETFPPINLTAIPTRIFGIGLHKTATNSLHTALKTLGYDSAHWESPKRAKEIYMDMTTMGRSRALEQHYAWCDLPIPVIYQLLDLGYPGSKFILTIRDERSWLNSVKNHWDGERNKWRKTWDRDGFTHKIHTVIYGQKEFDADIFLARYRQHNEEVQEYFRSRPDDLLVLDMSRGQGWPELCGFLGKPIPKVAYPREFATNKGE